jgi:tetratricopeptide (TPR) repeat protein
MSPSLHITRLLLALPTALFAFALGAQALLKPVPIPDLARLPEAERKFLADTRREFDQARVDLIGIDLAEAYAKLGAIYLRHGAADAAAVAFENGAALAPEDGRFPYLRGIVHLSAGELAPARAAFRRALALDQVYIPIRYRLASAELALGNPAGARTALGDLPRTRSELAPVQMLIGDVALAEKRHAEAVAAYRRALALDAGASAIQERLARALEAQGDRSGAAAARAKAGPVEPAFGDPLVQGIFSPGSTDPVAQALSLAAQARHAEARALLDAALKATPDASALLAASARVEGDAGRLDIARSRASAALRAAPDDASVLVTVALLAELEGKDSEALAGYERAVRADLEHAEARLLLGHALMRAGRFSSAAEQYRQLTRLDASDSRAWLRLAAAEARAGRCSAALTELNGALKSRPRDGTLLEGYVRLASTCPGVSTEVRQVAVDYGRALYEQLPNEDHSEALAMAMAATGKRQEAVDFQAQAMFEALKRKDDAAVARLKVELDNYKAGRIARAPWPAGHPLVAPARLTPSITPATAR